MRMTTRRITSFLVVITVSVLVGCALIKTVNAEEQISWTNAVPKVVKVEDTNGNSNWRDDCQARFHGLKTAVPLNVNDVNAKTDCLVGQHSGAKILSYASYQALAVQFPGDTSAYPIGVGCLSCVYIEGNDTFINVESNNDVRSGRVVVYKNFLKRLHFVNSPLKSERYYSFDSTSPDHIISNFYGNAGYVGYMKHIQRSSNGKWLVVEFTGTGLFRVNLETMEILKFSDWHTDYWSSRPFIEYDVTNDGRHIAVFGENTLNSIFDIVSGCGNIMPSILTEDQLARNQQIPCPELNLNAPRGDVANNTYMPRLRNTYQPEFNDDGGELSFYASSYDPITPRRIVLQAANYTPSPYLDYLALGDSYSSGEGDIERKTDGTGYYRSWTDNEENDAIGVPREMCHISTRSYPYRLASSMNLSLDGPKKWNTIACAGALTYDISGQESSAYWGQDKGDDSHMPRLKGYDVRNLKDQALNEFIPGRQKQIEFVKKYKPKAITLTVGGNDVGFAPKLVKCASDASTCEYVLNDSRKAAHGYEIKNEFYKLKSLYRELRDTSWDTKIYVMGYPSFINPDTWRNCAFDDGYLSGDEKIFIDESLKYMNMIIQAAANAAGAKYIDLENSLSGGRICDVGGEYITSLHDTWFKRLPELFHPNAIGHEKITEAIKSQLNNQNLLDYSFNSTPDNSIAPPTSPSYFYSVMQTYDKNGARYEPMTGGTITKGQPGNIITGELLYGSDTEVVTSMFSEPTNLGVIKARSDGSLNTQINIPPNISVGYHTLVFSGKSYSNEPIELYETVLVQGSNPDDRDEDGINDIHDECMFIKPANEDVDLDGVDDMCDPSIGTPQYYRVRTDDANYIYIERNVYAESITGVREDADPDNDGWAIIAKSQGRQYSSTSIPDIGPIVYDEIMGEGVNMVPHVFIRAGDHGCIEYIPNSMSKVLPEEVRNLKLIATNTSKCRQESPAADLDGNNIPDNVQPLYMARNGNPAVWHIKPDGQKIYEDPSRLYLFRNFYAAEAQLGVSDYSPTGTAAGRSSEPIQQWNLLASSQSLFTKGVYSKLIILSINNQPMPIIFAKNFFLCFAFQPKSTTIIQSTTQYKNDFKLVFSLSGGNACE